MENADLGQVFTKRNVADYMVDMFTLKDPARILDPCFGKGVFIESLYEKTRHEITGVELDEHLFHRCTGKFQSRCTCVHGDFLKFQTDQPFDGIIMNPPYIRQEKIDGMEVYGIKKADIRKNRLYKHLSSNANLYMYFVLKGISLLKAGGEMLVIFPGTWLRAANGAQFKQAVMSDCAIVRTVFVKGEPFESDAIVDVVILKLVKDPSAKCMAQETVHIKDGKICQEPEPLGTQTGLFEQTSMISFGSMAKIRRGLTTCNNKMFVNPQKSYGKLAAEDLTPILSSPKDVKGFTTKDYRPDMLFWINEKNMDHLAMKDYIRMWKKRILAEGEPKTIYDRIKAGDKQWYRLSEVRAEGLLFGYIVRKDMKFIDAQCHDFVRDNFYIIKPLIDKDMLFALLNNYYTFYQLECSGKHYGAGVLKLQKYDLEQLYLINPEEISAFDKDTLKSYVNHLKESGEKHMILQITEVLARYAPVGFEKIIDLYENVKRKRLEVNV